jgi:hypothetical protein
MRKFVGTVQTKKVNFMGSKLEIRKLTAGAVERIGKLANEKSEAEDSNALDTVAVILNEAVVLPEGEDPIDLELLREFPLDELNNVVNEVMAYAGVVAPLVEKVDADD